MPRQEFRSSSLVPGYLQRLPAAHGLWRHAGAHEAAVGVPERVDRSARVTRYAPGRAGDIGVAVVAVAALRADDAWHGESYRDGEDEDEKDDDP
ncbi:hypothetical protein A2862_03150 [Candidatus Roizmanbacteria bacterium RIFCSPHIGHO2_01_FULL_38_41]|uniref:Uncharacterized protein n=1 Tax=Candidatus Roizmanbacteria bacterium RIFCSPHIGHO2_02_FULL_37_24 TaxID=1802037 RepID=A0A1F7GV77_9BACT|nr:MAG: hypothetical protein A2862_03150 [Candidatus Roizmanbacteria bacterium RIFCSPHIGHO2_01_FULL_38_41]OGK22516.1 MAG: hypothetical protein A3C24_05125 [Candidatus Roizmanbacteria bacterium RIFCSPHIGHO2_02_FULL_37_24]OGK33916.1 MAG: hypothetical protein A3E10_01910 [Candidatus Roizmanbacteria bacterium RIFCSPHIGHO2_12_FULL_37_23]OGK43400.1 MAG: hypothetical protein A2956_04390 [Candidatus Roizmanbacteria bacterium RIFCSPLOWO2_01_FULL_37_57]